MARHGSMDGLLNDGLMVAGGALWRQFAGFGATNKGWWWRQEAEEPIRRHNHYGNDEFPTQFPIQCCFIQPASQAHTIIYDMMIWLNERKESEFCSQPPPHRCVGRVLKGEESNCEGRFLNMPTTSFSICSGTQLLCLSQCVSPWPVLCSAHYHENYYDEDEKLRNPKKA